MRIEYSFAPPAHHNRIAPMTAKTLFALFLLTAPSLHAKTLIEAAYDAGELDLETALLFQLQSLRDPDQLPAQYRQTYTRPLCGTPQLLQVLQAAPHFGPDYRRRLGKIVQRRPSRQQQYRSPAGRFLLHYDTSGSEAVPAEDADGNGIPDYIELAATVLDSTWVLEVDGLGYDPPPSDNGLDGDEYDVYFSDLGRGAAYGYTYPEQGGNTTYSYLELDNDFTNPVYQQTRGHDALRVTIAHEFHHAVQFGYYQGNDGIWWQESTSTWMEEVAYPEIDDYLQYLPSFLGVPHRALNSGGRLGSDFHIYGTSIFSHFLDQRYNREVNRLIWEELARRASARLEHFDRALRAVEPGGLGAVVGQFAVWNYFTGHRHRDDYYAEGFKYPTVPPKNIEITAKTAVRDSSDLDATGNDYLLLQPALRPGGVTFTFDARRGDFIRHLLLLSHRGVEIRPVSEPSFRVTGWDQYDEIVLVVSSAENAGFAYDYLYEVEYDPDLTDAPAALATALRPSYPNPFQPILHQQTRLIFDLTTPSVETRVAIFSPSGDLVWQQVLGTRAAREGHAVAWDGRNLAGKLVGTGVYHVLLETDGQRLTRSLAVVRK